MEEESNIKIKKIENNVLNHEYNIEHIGEKYSNEYNPYKIILIGDKSVGKTSICLNFIKKEFINNIPSTMSVQIDNYQIKINNKIIQMQFWDTCGIEEFYSYTPNLFQNADMALFVFAINDKKSFENIPSFNDVLCQNNVECIKFLVGNKIDLEDKRMVKKFEGEDIKNKYGFDTYIEVSAKINLNVKNLLENIGISLYEKYEMEHNHDKNIINEDIKKSQHSLIE